MHETVGNLINFLGSRMLEILDITHRGQMSLSQRLYDGPLVFFINKKKYIGTCLVQLASFMTEKDR